MRTWLTLQEQNKLEKLYKNSKLYPKNHIHLAFNYYNNFKQMDIDLNESDIDINCIHYKSSDYKLNGELSYKSWTLSQLLDMLPSTIYCDNEYNTVDINTTKIYHSLKLHIIKKEDINEDINYKYKICYKPLKEPAFKKRIVINNSRLKEPSIESDELIELVYDLLLWCISHGHLPSTKDNKEVKLIVVPKKIISRGH